MALDRDEIVDLTKEGMARPAVNLFPESDPFHNDNADPGHDLDEAKKLVDEYEPRPAPRCPSPTCAVPRSTRPMSSSASSPRPAWT